MENDQRYQLDIWRESMETPNDMKEANQKGKLEVIDKSFYGTQISFHTQFSKFWDMKEEKGSIYI